MQLEIKTTIDAFNPSQVKALNDFLIAIGGAEETVGKLAEALEPISMDKVKLTRKKAEKVETLSPEDFVKESNKAFKNAIEEVKTETQDEVIEDQKVEAIEVVEPETVSAPTLMQIRSLVAQKAGEHKDSIKSKLVELGAQNVSTLDAKHFQTIFAFLNEL